MCSIHERQLAINFVNYICIIIHRPKLALCLTARTSAGTVANIDRAPYFFCLPSVAKVDRKRFIFFNGAVEATEKAIHHRPYFFRVRENVSFFNGADKHRRRPQTNRRTSHKSFTWPIYYLRINCTKKRKEKGTNQLIDERADKKCPT